MTYPTWESFPESLWGPLTGGLTIGAAAVLLMAVNGRIAGISGIAARLLPPTAKDGEALGRALFLLGLVAGPLLLLRLGGVLIDMSQPETPLPLLLLAGLMVGFGSVLGSGCTSGHGICGLARFSPRSALAVAVFMATGAVAVFTLRHMVGG